MTIKHISKLVSLTLAVIIIGFAVAVSWSLNHLNQAFASVEFFGQQKDKIFTQVSQPMLNYLLTGEATIIGDVERTLNQIKTEVEGRANLSASLQAPFTGLIDDLQQNTMPELTAAGKLADPQALLINNEKQLSQHLQKLLSYVKEAHKAPQAKQQLYLKLVGDSQAALINLARARQSFFTSRKQMSPDNINRPLQELIVLADEFKKLPLLGVMKQESAASDVLSFDEKTEAKQPEDKAIEPISEIPSLLQHYSKDMELALRITQDKITGQAKVKQQLDNLQQRLLTLEAELTGEYQHYEHLMFIIMAACSLLIISAVLICIFGGARILRRVSGLESIMSKIAHTSDLSLRAEALHNDEIGSMARSFNSMVEQLQETSKLVKQKINDIQTMLQYMPQGLLSFDDQNKIKPEYSAYLERILETDQIAGNDLIKLVFANSNLGSDAISQISAISGACVGEDAMNFEFNQHLLVNEIEKEMQGGLKKVLDLNWAPVVNENDVVEQILLCVRDVTELRKLSAEAEGQKRELEIIGEILGVSQEKFHEFITSSVTYIDEIENTIRANPDGSEDAINAMFRNMHTIKGNARTYGLTNLTNQVHDTESMYDELRQPNSKIAWDQTRLLDDLAQVRQLIEHYAKTNEVSLGRKGPGRRGSVEKYLMVDNKQIQETIKLLEKVSHSNIHDLIEAKNIVHRTLRLLGTETLDISIASMVESLPELSQSLGKPEPEVSINNGKLRLKTQSVGVIKDIFTHLFRNCVDHGLETPADRLVSGKPAQGRIDVAIEMENDQLKISIKDDGRGLALNKIRQKALDNGLIQGNENLNDEKIAALIFLPGFSTADKLTDISGRGVGMDAVLGFARKEGGNVKINFLDNKEGSDRRAFETAVYLPANYAVSTEEESLMVTA
ncbi:MAG: Hpt domain-containing protein [Candidatus Paceibacterota bacterium]|jgi:two-component system chemotaxis sensor kinase CheA